MTADDPLHVPFTAIETADRVTRRVLALLCAEDHDERLQQLVPWLPWLPMRNDQLVSELVFSLFTVEQLTAPNSPDGLVNTVVSFITLSPAYPCDPATIDTCRVH